jgi:hypothetical protein
VVGRGVVGGGVEEEVGVFFLANLDFFLFGLLGSIISDGKYFDGVLEVVVLVSGGASVRDSCTAAIASRTTSRLHKNVIISNFYVYNTIQYNIFKSSKIL